MGRTCQWCGERLEPTRRAQIKTCGGRCRTALHRAQRGTGVPAEMRRRPNWVRHVAKRPVTVAGTPASSTDPTTWTTYGRVRAYKAKGFVLDGTGLVCIDLDHCLRDGRVVGRAAEVLASCPATYVEVSPSGDGLHVWGFGQVPSGRRLPGGVEVYGTGRFVTVSGKRFGGTSRLADLSAVIAGLV